MTLRAVAVAGRGLVDPGGPVFRADDEALLRGAAAFETIRVYDGTPFLLDEHASRFRFSVGALALAPPAELAPLVELVLGAGPPDGVLRLYRTSHDTIATLADLPEGLEEQRAQGITLRSVDLGAPALLAGVKSTSYAAAFAARRLAEERGADDALLVADGVVLETATANVWWCRDGELFTPTTGAGVLPGVTRAFVLGLEQATEGAFDLADLQEADEAFTTSSIREVMPVVAIDGRTVGDGRPGPAAARLQAAIRLHSRR